MTNENSNEKENSVTGYSLFPTLTALLKPTADYLGTELRDTVKSKIEEAKAERRKLNLAKHMKSVQEEVVKNPVSESSNKPTLEQLDFFDQWTEHVQEIDPEHTELSKIWNNLLVSALKGEDLPTEVIEVIKIITPREAQFLSKFKINESSLRRFDPFLKLDLDSMLRHKTTHEVRYIAASLEKKGLIEIRNYFKFFLFLGSSLALRHYKLTWVSYELLKLVNFGSNAHDKRNNPC